MIIVSLKETLTYILSVNSWLYLKDIPDLRSTLGTETAGNSAVGQAGNLSLALLDDGHGEDGQVSVDDASADGLSLLLSSTALTVAGVSLAEQKTNTAGGENSLLHGESLLVVASGDAENITLPFVTQGGGIDLHAHALFIERTNLKQNAFLNTVLKKPAIH